MGVCFCFVVVCFILCYYSAKHYRVDLCYSAIQYQSPIAKPHYRTILPYHQVPHLRYLRNRWQTKKPVTIYYLIIHPITHHIYTKWLYPITHHIYTKWLYPITHHIYTKWLYPITHHIYTKLYTPSYTSQKSVTNSNLHTTLLLTHTMAHTMAHTIAHTMAHTMAHYGSPEKNTILVILGLIIFIYFRRF